MANQTVWCSNTDIEEMLFSYKKNAIVLEPDFDTITAWQVIQLIAW